MFKYEDILARIHSGESTEDIVKEFTEAVNKAEAEAAKSKANAARKQAGEELIAAVRNYLNIVHPDLAAEMGDKVTDVDAYLDMLDSSLKSVLMLKNFKIDNLFGSWFPTNKAKVEIDTVTKSDLDAAIDTWLKKMGL